MRTSALPQTDTALIARSQAEPELFGLLFERHFSRIYSYLARRAGRASAEDLASQTFVVAFERRQHFDPAISNALPWLYGIATNLLRNHVRAVRRADATVLRVAAVSPVSGESLEPETMSAVLRVIDKLAADQREALFLFAWADLTYSEISEVLDVPIGTVASRIARAREILRADLISAEPTNGVNHKGTLDHE